MFGLCDMPHCKCRSQCRPVVTVRSKDPPPGQKPFDRFLRNAAGLDRYEVQYEVQMEFCSAHQDTFREKFILNEGTWSAIENQLRAQGMADPDKDSVRVRWEPAAGADGLDEVGRTARAIAHGAEAVAHPMSRSLQTGTVDETKRLASEGLYPRGM